jgi:hypothetical protein
MYVCMYLRSSEGCSLNDLGMFLVNFNILSILTLIILINEIFYMSQALCHSRQRPSRIEFSTCKIRCLKGRRILHVQSWKLICRLVKISKISPLPLYNVDLSFNNHVLNQNCTRESGVGVTISSDQGICIN